MAQERYGAVADASQVNQPNDGEHANKALNRPKRRRLSTANPHVLGQIQDL